MFSCILKLNAILFRPLIIIYVFECYTYNVITDDYVTIRKKKHCYQQRHTPYLDISLCFEKKLWPIIHTG